MAETITYEFVFKGGFDETVFSQYSGASAGLRTIVQATLTVEQDFLKKYPKVNALAQEIKYEGLVFKVKLEKAA